MSSQNPTTAHNFQDLSGKRFGQLQVTSRDRRGGKKAFWLCKCDCGEDYVAQSYYLTSGARTDCGCRRIEKSKDARKKYHDGHQQPVAVAICLSDGDVTVVDQEDYLMASGYWWTRHKGTRTNYARAVVEGRRVLLHVLIMGELEGRTVDHINGNGLDNRRCNLRWATKSQQCQNNHVGRGRSIFKGVSWAKRQRKWMATISINGKNKHIGYFDNESDAARAYNKEAANNFGEFAWLNDVEEASCG